MLERLGPNVWHETPAAAMAVLEELEETARLQMLARPAARPAPLDAAQIDELRTHLRCALVVETSHAPIRRQPLDALSELDFLDRFDAAAKDGFKAVEYLFPYAFAKEESPRA
jgi:hypothetical protein